MYLKIESTVKYIISISDTYSYVIELYARSTKVVWCMNYLLHTFIFSLLSVTHQRFANHIETSRRSMIQHIINSSSAQYSYFIRNLRLRNSDVRYIEAEGTLHRRNISTHTKPSDKT